MVEKQTAERPVLVDRALVAQLLESGERALDGMSKIVEGLHALSAGAAEPLEPEVPAPTAEPRTWDTSEDALSNYDAEQLVALRADHRAGVESAQGEHVAAALVRRLGSL